MAKTYPVPCTKEEMDALIESAKDDDFFYMLLKVMRKTGRRLGEYYDVKVKDVDFQKKIMMTKVLKRRMRVEKEAILDDDLVFLIKMYIVNHQLTLDDYLFRKVGYRQIEKRISAYGEKAGIPHRVSPHSTRHFFVSELFKKGWTYDKIAKLTGHSSPGTLVQYDHTVASDIADEAREAIKDL